MRRGMTLVELMIVLVVLVALASLIVPLVGDLTISTPGRGEQTPQEVATEASLRAVRNAILGTPTSPGLWPDLGQHPDRFPKDPQVLLFDLELVRAQVDPAMPAFDPVTRIGWRGPYLRGGQRPVDAWGQPLLIQVPVLIDDGVWDAQEVRYARLVSAGPDGQLDTQPEDGYLPGDGSSPEELSLAECGDDLVLFFRVPDLRE